MELTRNSLETNPGPSEWFTGSVYIDTITAPSVASPIGAAAVHFTPGARTAWHSHDRGQLLMVEEGRMRAQQRGQPIKEFGAGESEYTAPNVVHWHGAAAGQALVQLNVGFGGGAKWFEDVSDAEYLKARQPRTRMSQPAW